MYVDLHVHTYFSDGTQSPEEVVAAAKAQGLSAISICDHNLILAYDRLRPACEAAGIQLVQGVEIDVYWQSKKVHLLAYRFDPEDQDMRGLLAHSRAQLDLVSVEMIRGLEKDDPRVSLAEYAHYSRPLGRGGWDGINYLLDKGLTESLEDGMRYYGLYPGFRPDYVTLEEACHIVRKAGGMPVLAHPGVYWEGAERERTALSAHFEDMHRLGLGGIECYYPEHDAAFTQACLDFCHAKDLRITYGGDGHGDFFREVEGVVYDIGVMKVEQDRLDLRGIL